MLNIRKFLTAIKIIPVNSSGINSKGEVEVLDSSGKMQYHNGTTPSPVVTEAHSAVLTNKTIDGDDNTVQDLPLGSIKTVLADANKFLVRDGSGAPASANTVPSGTVVGTSDSQALTNKTIDSDLNTLSNIKNSDIKVGADIARSKLAAGTAKSVVLNDAAGNLSSTTLTSGQILVGNSSDIPTAVTPSGDVTITNAGVTAISSGVIVDGDINASAAIARSKLATGTANHVIINDALGNLSSESKLVESRGGTNQSTYTTGDILYASASNTLSKLGVGSTGQVLTVSGGSPSWKPAGGAGGVNFMGLDTSWALANGDDRNAESSVGNWAAYADAAAAIPVDMTGGSPTVTIARTTTATEILNGAASFKVVKDAANRQGQGVSCIMNVPVAYQGKNASISIPYRIISGSVVSGDVKVFIYDVTNSQIITPFNNDLIGTVGQIAASFAVSGPATSPANIQLRVGFHFASTSATAVTFAFDDVTVGPVNVTYGMAGSDWTAYTPTTQGLGTISSVEMFYRRVGDTVEIRGSLTTGTVSATEFRLGLPSGLTSDSSKITSIAYGGLITQNGVSSAGDRHLLIEPGVTYFTAGLTSSGSNGLAKLNGDTFGNSMKLSVIASAPVSGWSSNVQMASSSSFYVSSVLANGTRVTGTAPTQLGQYRSYRRNASANTYTETSADPSSLPSTSNGMRIWTSGAYGTADPVNQPSKYEIFIGKNKNINFEWYRNTGRTGYIDTSVWGDTSAGYAFGIIKSYDPTTGILMLENNTWNGLGAMYIGFGVDYVFVNNGYFDIKVSENALAVGVAGLRSTVRAYNGNGSGSGNNIRRFSNNDTTGSSVTFSDSSSGSIFTINEDGVYSISRQDLSSAGATTIGISVNASSLVTGIQTLTVVQGNIGWSRSSGVNDSASINVTVALRAGDVVRGHDDGPNLPNRTDTGSMMTITKVDN